MICHFCHKQLPPPGEGIRGIRELLAEALESLGAKESKTLTKTTDFLVVGIKPSPAKLKKAAKLNIPLICGECAMEEIIGKGKIPVKGEV